MPSQTTFDLALLALLFFSSLYDLAQRRIPNYLLLCGLLISAGLHLAHSPASLLSVWLAGFTLGLVLFLPLYLLHAMAAGDVKLMASVGAFTGPALAFEISLASYCIGGVLAFLIALATGRLRNATSNICAVLYPYWLRVQGVPAQNAPMPKPSVGGMPYALAISGGTLLMLWIRHT